MPIFMLLRPEEDQDDVIDSGLSIDDNDEPVSDHENYQMKRERERGG